MAASDKVQGISIMSPYLPIASTQPSVRRRSRRFDRPDFLEVVERPHLGAEQVDDHVAGVDQHPVAVRQALDPGLAGAGLFQRAHQVVGDGADMAVRAPGRDDHAIGDRAFVFQVDEYDVLGLIVVETGQNEVLQTFYGGKVLVLS